MNRSRLFTLWVLTLTLFVFGTTIFSLAQAGEPASVRSLDAQTGYARLISFEAGALGMPVRSPETLTEEVASAAVDRYASAFGAPANSGFTRRDNIARTEAVTGSAIAVRYAQNLGGVQVYGAELVVNVRGDGALLSISGEASSVDSSELNLTPEISAAAAGLSAARYVAFRYGVAAETLKVEDAGLWVYDPAVIKPARTDERAGLVWQTVVSSMVGHPLRVIALVNAASGDVRFSFNTIHASAVHGDWSASHEAGVNLADASAQFIGPRLQPEDAVRAPGTADLATYNANNLAILPGTLVCTETNLACTSGGDIDADTAHRHADGTYQFYWDLHNRDSLNGSGMQLISSVHYSYNYCNAFWDGEQMAYGDGCEIVVDDVVAHELTHGVTEFTSNLVYAYDSGAINESFSDVWGEYYDLSNGTSEDTPANRWVIGEEVDMGGIRNMKDPTLFTDPDRVGSPFFWTDARDIGGVHINSGINNKAAYLLADGGTFNGQTITALGMQKPLHIYYYVQTMLATPGSTYNDLALYLAQACNALVGGSSSITVSDCAQVDKVVLATEMALPSPHLPGNAEVCSVGLQPQDLFIDTFENSAASSNNWVTAASYGSNAWTVSSSALPLDGARSMRANNVASSSNSTATLRNGIVVPANAYLHFDQKYLWEYDGWDGSVIQYSTNDGASWTSFVNAQMEGEKYPGRMEAQSSAAFAGSYAFTGDSFGPGSTRISLTQFAGQTLKIRFFASSDELYDQGNPDGWWIDNVRVYTCIAEPVAGSNVLTNGSFEMAGATAKTAFGWTGVSLAPKDKRHCEVQPAHDFAFDGTCAFRFMGTSNVTRQLKQAFINPAWGTSGNALTLSLQAKTQNITPNAKVILKVVYTDGTSAKAPINLPSGTNPYALHSVTHVLEKPAKKVVVVFKSSITSGKFWVDDVSLVFTNSIRHGDAARGADILPPPALPDDFRNSN